MCYISWKKSSSHANMDRRRVHPELQSASYRRLREWNATRTRLSPRMKIGLQAYACGAVKSLREAADMVGCHPVSLSMAARSPAGQYIMDSVDQIVKDKTMTASQLIQKLSRRMVEIEAHTAEHSQNEALRLKAAQDLLDRNPETSKTQKIQADILTMDGKDAQAIARAMVEAAALKDRHVAAVQGDYVKVDSKEDIFSGERPAALGLNSGQVPQGPHLAVDSNDPQRALGPADGAGRPDDQSEPG